MGKKCLFYGRFFVPDYRVGGETEGLWRARKQKAQREAKAQQKVATAKGEAESIFALAQGQAKGNKIFSRFLLADLVKPPVKNSAGPLAFVDFIVYHGLGVEVD